MSKLADKQCEVCLRRGIQKKARTLCDECREFFCKECSDTHLVYKLSMNHSLIDLDPPREEARSASEDELASDFLEHVTVSETTVLYRAQVAVEGGSKVVAEEQNRKAKKEAGAKHKQKVVDIAELKPRQIKEFSVKRPDDKVDVNVRGVLVVGDKVIIVDNFNKKLKLFDSSGSYLSSTDLREYSYGITRVIDGRFVTCGYGNKVFLWTLRGDTIVSEDDAFDVDRDAYGIHYNNTYYCVLHRWDNAVIILDRQGRRVRKIVMKEAFGKEIMFGWDIHMDSDTHNIYIPCWSDNSGVMHNSGVLCMSVEGEALWFTPILDIDVGLFGIVEIFGAVCIADGRNNCLHLVSKTGQYIRKLMEMEEGHETCDFICNDETQQKLYAVRGEMLFVYWY